MTYNSQNSIIEHIFHLEDSIHHCIVCIAELMNSRDRELCNLYIMKREYVERIRKCSYISVYRDICLSLLNLLTFQNNNIQIFCTMYSFMQYSHMSSTINCITSRFQWHNFPNKKQDTFLDIFPFPYQDIILDLYRLDKMMVITYRLSIQEHILGIFHQIYKIPINNPTLRCIPLQIPYECILFCRKYTERLSNNFHIMAYRFYILQYYLFINFDQLCTLLQDTSKYTKTFHHLSIDNNLISIISILTEICKFYMEIHIVGRSHSITSHSCISQRTIHVLVCIHQNISYKFVQTLQLPFIHRLCTTHNCFGI